MATKKIVKKIVKKPLMKKGGIKKPLRKAQPGMAVGPYAASDLPPASKDKNIYAGPINEIEAKQMDEDYPSTVGKAPAMEGRGSKKTGYFSPIAVEASRRREDENYLRSNDPTVQKWNAIKNENKDQYPTTKKTDFKKGGSIKKMKTGGRVNPNAKVQASKTAGSKGVKSGANSKASASKVAKGRSGGTSKAPKTAAPKAMYGRSMKNYQDGGAASKFGVKSYNFMDTKTGGRADSSSKQVEGVKYGEGNKRKYIDLDANKGTMTKTKFNKNNESSTKVKNIGTKRVADKISKITSQKIGGAVKRK